MAMHLTKHRTLLRAWVAHSQSRACILIANSDSPDHYTQHRKRVTKWTHFVFIHAKQGQLQAKLWGRSLSTPYPKRSKPNETEANLKKKKKNFDSLLRQSKYCFYDVRKKIKCNCWNLNLHSQKLKANTVIAGRQPPMSREGIGDFGQRLHLGGCLFILHTFHVTFYQRCGEGQHIYQTCQNWLGLMEEKLTLTLPQNTLHAH